MSNAKTFVFYFWPVLLCGILRLLGVFRENSFWLLVFVLANIIWLIWYSPRHMH